MASDKKSPVQFALLGYAQEGGKNVGLFLSSRAVRLLLLIVAVGVAAFLLYSNVFKTLSEPVALPDGVLEANPELDNTSLQAINNARVSRSQYQLKSFVAFDSFFVPGFTPTPSPTP